MLPTAETIRFGAEYVVGEVTAQSLLRQCFNGVLRPEDRPPQRMAGPQILGEELVNEVVRRVLDHLDLFEDDLLFPADVLGAERRVHDDVGEHLDGQRQMLIEHFEVVARVFLGREGIHLSADGIDRSARCPRRFASRSP